MKKPNNILEELLQIAPQLAKVEKKQPFQVPENYFSTLEQTVLARCSEQGEVKAEAPTFSALPKIQPFKTPANYFEQLQASILNKVQQETETDLASPLIDKIAKERSFSVPANYFAELPVAILKSIHLEEKQAAETDILSPIIQEVTREEAFSVPVGYFEQLQASIIEKVQEIEYEDAVEPSSPVLYKLGKENPFTVPENYFEELGDSIMKQTVSQPSRPKVVPMNATWTRQRAIRYGMSIAAMLTLFVFGLFVVNTPGFFNNSGLSAGQKYEAKIIPMPEVMSLLQSLTQDDMLAYVTENIDEYEDLLEEEGVLENIDVSKLNKETKQLNLDVDIDVLEEYLEDFE